MKTINLFRGKKAFVDNDDYLFLRNYTWHITNSGYAERSVYIGGGRKNPKIKMLQMHHLILKRMGLDYTNKLADHINGDTLDNRRENLRLCNYQENARNRKINKNNLSGYKGVRKKNNKWEARITVGGKTISLGSWRDQSDAITARNQAEKKYFGEFSRLAGFV